MIQRPTSSTLFPYTTLFRSTVIVSDREGDAVILGVVVRSGVGVDFKVDGGTVSRIRGPREAQRVPRPRRDAEVRDVRVIRGSGLVRDRGQLDHAVLSDRRAPRRVRARGGRRQEQ